MTTPRLSILTILLTLTACGPDGMSLSDTDAGTDGFDTGLDTGTSGYVDPPPPLECGGVEYHQECDANGVCWSWSPSWSNWAQSADLVAIDSMVQQGYLQPTAVLNTAAECYRITSTDSHACVACVDQIPLLGRPVDELLLTDSDCAGVWLYPWTFVGKVNEGGCYGVIDNVAVQLDPEH